MPGSFFQSRTEILDAGPLTHHRHWPEELDEDYLLHRIFVGTEKSFIRFICAFEDCFNAFCAAIWWLLTWPFRLVMGTWNDLTTWYGSLDQDQLRELRQDLWVGFGALGFMLGVGWTMVLIWIIIQPFVLTRRLAVWMVTEDYSYLYQDKVTEPKDETKEKEQKEEGLSPENSAPRKYFWQREKTIKGCNCYTCTKRKSMGMPSLLVTDST